MAINCNYRGLIFRQVLTPGDLETVDLDFVLTTDVELD